MEGTVSLPLLTSSMSGRYVCKETVKVVDLYSSSTWGVCKALKYSMHCQGISQFYLHTLHFIRKRNEPYLPLPSQPQLVLIYRPRRDGRLSRPWCKVAEAEIRTCCLPIANPALYHTATSTLLCNCVYIYWPHTCLQRPNRGQILLETPNDRGQSRMSEDTSMSSISWPQIYAEWRASKPVHSTVHKSGSRRQCPQLYKFRTKVLVSKWLSYSSKSFNLHTHLTVPLNSPNV